MKYVRIERDGAGVWGVLEGEIVRTLAQPPFEGLSYDGESFPLADCRLLAPCQPTKIVCVGKNYAEHARELGGEAPDHPILFLKGLNALNRPEGLVTAPAFVRRLDYEGELGVVIRRRAKNVKADDFRDYILGYTCFNDVTARDVQKLDGQWTRAKSMDGFAPAGPWVTTDADPADLGVETRLNGAVCQSGRTSQFLTPVPQLLEFITASMTLEPGDIIATGTPAGIGPMKPGDVVEISIEGIGTLRNHVV